MASLMQSLDLPPGLKPWHGLAPEALAELLGVHVTTARRWRRTGEAPAAVLRALAVLRFGRLGPIDPAWSGWILRDGELWSPENEPYTPGMVRAGPLHAESARLAVARAEAAEAAAAGHYRRAERLAALAELNAALDTVREAMARVSDSLPDLDRREVTRQRNHA